MRWITRAEQPLVNLDHVASVYQRKKEGYPEVYVVFKLAGGDEIEWETDSYDAADGVIHQIKTLIEPQAIRLGVS